MAFITYVVLHLCIMLVHELQEPYFDLCLVQESLFILYDLNGNPLLLQAVIGLHNLPAGGDKYQSQSKSVYDHAKFVQPASIMKKSA